jgi:apolipoprotein N-acyltransferase
MALPSPLAGAPNWLRRSEPLLWLVIYLVTNLFSFGRYSIAPFSWLAIVVALLYLRRYPTWKGFLSLWLIGIAVTLVTLRGLIPMPSPIFEIFVLTANALGLLPYLVDRLLVRRIGGFVATLLFPAAALTYAFLDSFSSAWGTWGSPVYTMMENPLLVQSLSLFGLWGLYFLMHWTASVAAWVWEERLRGAPVRMGVAIYALVWFGLVVSGGLQLLLDQPTRQTVRVAMVASSSLYQTEGTSMEVLSKVMTQQAGDAERTEFAAAMTGQHDAMLAQSRVEAAAGAKMIFWPEGAAMVLAEDEPALLAKAQQMAQETGVYLGIGMGVLRREGKGENKFVVIDPAGAVVVDYLKSYLVQGAEDGFFVAGDGVMPVIDTPYGRLAVAICHDMDHYQFIAQAGKLDVDLLVIPTGDWPSIERIHLDMAVARAIEQGVTIIRPTRGGMTASIDPQGRITSALSTADAELDGTPIAGAATGLMAVVANVSVQGMPTLYGQTGDWFGWLVVALFLVLTIVGIVRFVGERLAGRRGREELVRG